MQTLGIELTGAQRLGPVFNGLQPLPGMLSVIVAAVAGAIGSLAALGFGLHCFGALLSEAAAFVVAMVLLDSWGRRSITRFAPNLETRFPSPSLKVPLADRF